MLVQSLMDDNQRMLSTYQYFNTINLAKSDSEDEDDGYDTIPKMESKFKGWVEEHHIRIEQFLKEYAEKTMSAEDYRLMNGVYTPKILRNNSIQEMGVSLYGRDVQDSHIKIDEDAKNDNNSTVMFDENEQVMSDNLHQSINMITAVGNSRSENKSTRKPSLAKILKFQEIEESKL